MKKIFLLIFLFSSFGLLAQEDNTGTKRFASYRNLSPYFQASPISFKSGLLGYQNPASVFYNKSDGEISLTYLTSNSKFEGFNNFAVFQGNKNSGIGGVYQSDGSHHIVDYRYSLAWGSRQLAFGLGYGFVGGDKSYYGRDNSYSLGVINRYEYLSWGLSYTKSFNYDDEETVFDIAVRPMGNSYPITLFADVNFLNSRNDNKLVFRKNSSWAAGVSWEFIAGARVNAKYFEDKSINIGVDLSFGEMGIGASNISTGDDIMGTAINLRFGGKDRSIMQIFEPSKNYLKLSLKGSIKYQRHQYFDNSRTLLDVLDIFDRAEKDETITGVVINAVGMRTSKAIMWEIRERIRQFKASGKKVIIFIERVGIDSYHFASVADEIVMDEFGSLSISGYSMSRSYYKDMLEKLGIGFDELRFFKYKSAYESFSRNDYSEGDREQRQALIDSWYATTKSEVARERKDISEAKFDELVNKQISYFASEAKDEGLIDRYGRWTNMKDVMKEIDSKNTSIVGLNYLYNDQEPIDLEWSNSSKNIAIIYALGVCSMEGGINARSLVNDIKHVLKSDYYDAVVLRVDSPGGDALASEYITKVIRDYKNDENIINKKPIIVSQGMVAASGGYWLSMDADKILASPVTVTGSIGVISGWYYDRGIAKDLGISTDLVQTGKYAGLGNSFREPLLGLGLPTKQLNDDERKQFEGSILKLYKDFVTKVAEGRGVKYDDIHEVAQGRIWSGTDGSKNGLVDEIGGLWTAINVAKSDANISKDSKINIHQFPKLKLFDFNALLSKFTGFNFSAVKETVNTVKFRMDYNGIPMPMLPLEYSQFDIEN